MKGKITKEKHSINTNEKSEREAAEKKPPRGRSLSWSQQPTHYTHVCLVFSDQTELFNSN